MYSTYLGSIIALRLSVCRLTDTVIVYEYAAFLHSGWKTESGSICHL